MSIPLSVQPHRAVLQVTGAVGAFVTMPVTSVSKTQPPASPPEELLDEPEELPDEPLLPLLPEELPEEPDELVPEELPEELLDVTPEDPLELLEAVPPSSPIGLLLLLLPHPVSRRPVTPAVIAAATSAKVVRVAGLMCRSRSRPGSAS
jgi:hypothetical protein